MILEPTAPKPSQNGSVGSKIDPLSYEASVMPGYKG